MFDKDSLLVTGASGSFGHAFISTVLQRFACRRLIVFSRDEYKQDVMRQALPQDSRLRWMLGDIRDPDRLDLALHDVQIVIHAAALKHVPALEYNPTEAIQTNVIGAMNLAQAAIRQGVQRVIALSTDKAVNPVNLYGATKLCAEKLLLAANALGGGRTRFSCVRYGNVAASRGSVIPKWRQYILAGQAVPLTHESMTRFWITLPQAVDLVLQALMIGQGGEVFIPRLPSFRMTDLAAAMGTAYRVTGIRSGEKIHETLISEDEAREAWVLPFCFGLGSSPAGALPAQETQPYTSDTNTRWLSISDLNAQLQGL